MNRIVTLSTPWPPSVNTYWRMARGAFYITKKGKDYRQTMTEIVQEQCLLQDIKGQFKGRLSLRAELFPPDCRRRDIDNVLKAMLDAVQHSGLIDDDNQFDHLEVERFGVITDGAVALTITELPDADPRKRIRELVANRIINGKELAV